MLASYKKFELPDGSPLTEVGVYMLGLNCLRGPRRKWQWEFGLPEIWLLARIHDLFEIWPLHKLWSNLRYPKVTKRLTNHDPFLIPIWPTSTKFSFWVSRDPLDGLKTLLHILEEISLINLRVLENHYRYNMSDHLWKSLEVNGTLEDEQLCSSGRKLPHDLLTLLHMNKNTCDSAWMGSLKTPI